MKMEQSNSQSSRPAKYVALTDPLYDYIARHRSRVVDPLLDALRAETESLGDVARMPSPPATGTPLFQRIQGIPGTSAGVEL